MIYSFAEFEVDDAEFLFLAQGDEVQLEPKVLRLLIYLLQNPNRLVRKQELLNALWPGATVTENALTRVVGLLRRALGDDSQNPRFLQTVPTAGYRFIAEICTTPPIYPKVPQPPVKLTELEFAETTALATPASSSRSARGRGWIAAGAVVLIIVAVLGAFKWKRGHKPLSAAPVPSAPSRSPSLPLAGDKARLAAARLRNPAAYEAYIRGRFLFLNEISHGDDIQYAAATRETEAAIRLDPQFADPYALLAQIEERGVHHGKGDISAAYARAYLLANQAIALDPQCSPAHDVLGELHADKQGDFRWEAAVNELKTAITLNPDDALAHGMLGNIYIKTGLLDRAMEQAEIAHHLDPSFNLYTGDQVRALEYQQHFQEASDLCVTLVDKSGCAIYLWESGQHEEAWTALQAGLRNPAIKASLGYELTTSEAFILAQRGEKREADRVIQSILRSVNLKSDTFFAFSEYHLGVAYAVMGEEARAIDLLDSSSLNGFPCYPLYANDPELAQLRRNPRFLILLERLRRQHEVFRKTL